MAKEPTRTEDEAGCRAGILPALHACRGWSVDPPLSRK
jgi:hypothetical protein